MRKISNLSQGIRSLQAKMRLLRDESDKALNESDETSASRDRLITQYDSIGVDLKDLINEWEKGRIALVSTMERHGHSRSVSMNRLSIPLSPALSLGGTTAVGGSPQDALRALNGVPRETPSRSSSASCNSDEQIFEAIALPRQRSTLTKEERIVKMREDGMKQAVAREKSQANTHLLKELETVIKLRPRGRTTG